MLAPTSIPQIPCEKQFALLGSGASVYLRGSKLGTPAKTTAQRRTLSYSIEAKYRGRGTDLSRVQEFRRHEKDTGSSEVQITQLSARITQLTRHLQENKKDYGSRRGLTVILSRRRHFMQYLYKHESEDKRVLRLKKTTGKYKKPLPKYDELIQKLNIRPLRIQAGRGVVVKATDEGLVVDDSDEQQARMQDGE